MIFARRAFTIAGIYGIIVLFPLYFAEVLPTASAGPPINHPEGFYGFVGCALAFQVLFVIIGRDPARMRPAMIASVLEKISFPAAVYPLYLAGRVPPLIVVFSTIDLMLAVLFTIAWLRTRPEAAA